MRPRAVRVFERCIAVGVGGVMSDCDIRENQSPEVRT